MKIVDNNNMKTSRCRGIRNPDYGKLYIYNLQK